MLQEKRRIIQKNASSSTATMVEQKMLKNTRLCQRLHRNIFPVLCSNLHSFSGYFVFNSLGFRRKNWLYLLVFSQRRNVLPRSEFRVNHKRLLRYRQLALLLWSYNSHFRVERNAFLFCFRVAVLLKYHLLLQLHRLGTFQSGGHSRQLSFLTIIIYIIIFGHAFLSGNVKQCKGIGLFLEQTSLETPKQIAKHKRIWMKPTDC